MNPERHAHLEEEASLWAARLEGGGMTDADRARLAAWLEADPEHHGALARFREVSALLERRFAEGASALAADVGIQRRHGRRRAIVFAVAAMVALGGFLLIARDDDYATRTAERRMAALDDGSRVELNAQTEIEVAFAPRERRVRLLRGEAWFSVAKDPTRPFTVETPAGVVRVTGTTFNVRAGGEARVEVTVFEGHVRVRATSEPTPDAEAVLTAGRQAVMAGGQVALRALSGDAADGVVAWRQGHAVFSDTPLREAVERFAAYHERRIRIDAEAEDLRLGGRYALDDLDGWLDAVQRILPVRVLKTADGDIRLARVK